MQFIAWFAVPSRRSSKLENDAAGSRYVISVCTTFHNKADSLTSLHIIRNQAVGYCH